MSRRDVSLSEDDAQSSPLPSREGLADQLVLKCLSNATRSRSRH